MKILSIATLMLLFSFVAAAQTKLISYKSHSGKIKHFKTALGKDPNLKRSDFGLIAPRWHIDTVVYNSITGLVVFKFHDRFYGRTNSKSDTIWQQLPYLPSPSKDSIIARIEAKYYDSNFSNNVTFLGFDAPTVKKKL